MFRNSNGQSYQTERELGKGGEGTVYTITENPDTVIKIYNDQFSKEQIAKLQYMASVWTEQLEKYTAWPRALLYGSNNQPVGFLMRKLENYYPLHMLFSPMDRKRLFPDKGYNFLVHVARNLCSAFNALHQLKVIVGDINEGNILVNVQGMVAFIDCDSFQVSDGQVYYFCQVGIPRYTPPELLRRVSFSDVVRTEETDSFSLGILIFQLLFLGRHPFAGRNNSQEDIDEDTAIRNHEFAYSLRKTSKRLSPPDAAFKIQYLPDGLVNLFHRAFEQEENRPAAAEWISAIDNCLKQIRACSVSKTHFYPGIIGFCPWCDFKARLGIVYFWDNSFVDHLSALGDMETFINGFKLTKLNIKVLPEGLSNVEVTAAPIDKKYASSIHVKLAVYAIIVLVTAFVAAYVTGWAILFGILCWSLNRVGPLGEDVDKELERRKGSYAVFHQRYFQLHEQYRSEVEVAKYNRGLPELAKLIAAYRGLPEELQYIRRKAEEDVYSSQLDQYLEKHLISDYRIEQFGASKKLLLYTAGIKTAADIDKLDVVYVKGIGPKNITYLKAWKRQVQSGFLYQPDQQLLNKKFAEAAQAVAAKRTHLETQLRQRYQDLLIIKNSLQLKQEKLEKEYVKLLLPYRQSEADLAAFQNLVNKYNLF